MSGKRYSAGAIFLQVVPVFANVQRAIEDEAKNIDRALSDQMERSGEKAGEKAGKAASKAMKKEIDEGSRDLSGSFEREFHKSVDEINKALGGINTNKLGNDLRKEVSSIKRELGSLKDLDLTLDVDKRKADAALADLEGRLRAFRDGAKIVFRSDIDDALRGIAKIKAAKESIEDPVEIEVSTDFKVAERQLSAFEKNFKKTAEKAAGHLSNSVHKESRKIAADLERLKDLRIGVDISGNRARAELTELMNEVKALGSTSPDIYVKVEAAKAYAELATFEAALDKIDKKSIDVKAKVDSDGRAKRGLIGLISGSEGAANSFRSFNGILLLVASTGPALVPILAAIAGGLLALGPAAAVGAFGLGSVLVGFSGIGDALSAMQSQQDHAATNAQSAGKRQASAAYAIRDAEEALSDARRNAARAAENAAERVADAKASAADAIKSALERQKDAQEEYRDSVREVADAERNLRDARKQAELDAASIATRQRKNAVDERQAVLDLFEAQSQFNAVMADGSSTNTDKEQASVNLEQAQIALNDTRTEQVALADEAADYAKNGVNGSEKVKTAQEQLSDAIRAQKDALEAVREAAEDADEARRDGAKMVSDAIEAQNETLSDNRRAIEDAQEAVRRARQTATEDLGAIDAQAQAVKAAFDKLGPAGRRFALFLFSLKSGFYEFRDAVQQAMLPAIQEAIEGFITSVNASKARDAMVNLAAAFGKFVQALSVSFQGAAWAGFFEMLAEVGPKISDAFGGAFIKILEAFASILTTAAPFALEFAEGFERMMGAFADWSASKEGQQMILDFIGYVKRVGPEVLDFFFQFVGTLAHALEALAPYGETVLGLLDGLFKFIASLPVDTLGTILATVFALITASQLAYGLTSLLVAAFTLASSPIGAVVFALFAIGLAIAYLWNTNEGFRAYIIDAWGQISKAVKRAWEEDLKPALTDLWAAIEDLWKDVIKPFIEWLGPIFMWMIKHLIPLYAKVFAAKIRFITDLIRHLLIPAFQVIASVFTWLWYKVLKPRIEDLSHQWDIALRQMKSIWENVLKPVWDFIAKTALPELETSFQNTVDNITGIWETLKKAVANPIRLIIEDVLNGGLIEGFNTVAKWVGQEGIPDIPVPKALQYASGGVLPGYTPGRDVHSFVSPTAGRLELSGGEAIMRPEWTAVMGPDYVNRMNKLAASGGVNALKEAVYGKGGYFLGGILPLRGASVSSHGNAYGHPAYDLNYPGYADYGKPIQAWKSGVVAQTRYVGDDSYGRWVVLNHGSQNSLYAHMSNFGAYGVGDKVAAGAVVGYVGDLGNTGTPPTSHLHFEISGGSVDYADTAGAGGEKGGGRKVPSWLMGIVKDPLATVKGWIMDPIKNASASITDTPFFQGLAKVPALLGEKVTDKVWDVIPGWVKSTAGWAGDAADWAVGGVKNAAGAAADAVSGAAGAVKGGAGAVADALGFADGGILPYNGTMMYDAGGYLPPGLTTVMNLTGRPEPVFTADQFDGMRFGNGDGEHFTYAPTFQGSDLTAADVVDDLDFARRRARRGGKYERSKT